MCFTTVVIVTSSTVPRADGGPPKMRSAYISHSLRGPKLKIVTGWGREAARLRGAGSISHFADSFLIIVQGCCVSANLIETAFCSTAIEVGIRKPALNYLF